MCVKVSYSVQPVGVVAGTRWRRHSKPRRGTNIRSLPLDWPSPPNGNAGDRADTSNGGQSAVLASTLLLAAGLLVILVMAVLIVFSVYYRPSNGKKNRKLLATGGGNRHRSGQNDTDADESEPMKGLDHNGRTVSGSIKTTLV